MNFQDLKKIEKADFYVNLAFRRATDRAEIIRLGFKRSDARIFKSKKIEMEKINVITHTIAENFEKIVKSFPSLDDLPEFYKELIKITVDMVELKKALSAVHSSRLVLFDIYRIYNHKIKQCTELPKINQYRQEFLGRASSIPRRIKKDLEFLENARKIMRSYPAIKTGIPTVAIAGFPNVGKSTLLSKLTTAKPEIKDYAFTTKGLNVGYMEQRYEKIQFIDTPGTLNRFERMNYIEKAAHLAIKYVAEKIIYVYDPTEEYSFDDQIKLHEVIKKFHKPIIIYISKADIANKRELDFLKDKYPNAITSPDELKKIKFI